MVLRPQGSDAVKRESTWFGFPASWETWQLQQYHSATSDFSLGQKKCASSVAHGLSCAMDRSVGGNRRTQWSDLQIIHLRPNMPLSMKYLIWRPLELLLHTTRKTSARRRILLLSSLQSLSCKPQGGTLRSWHRGTVLYRLGKSVCGCSSFRRACGQSVRVWLITGVGESNPSNQGVTSM